MSAQRPGTPNGHRAGRSAVANTVEVHVVRVFLMDKEPWVEAEHPVTGQRWKAPILLGGSNKKTVDFTPVTATKDPKQLSNARAVLLFGDHYRQPVLVGWRWSGNTQTLKLSAEQADPDENRTAAAALTDRIIKHGGSVFIISEEGEIVFDTDGADGPGPVKIQLQNGGYLRIARDGDAEERLLLAGPTLEYLAKLEAQVAALTARVVVLTAAQPDPVKAALNAIPLPGVPTAATSPLKAATVHISADAEVST
jgi:hypothetical protein